MLCEYECKTESKFQLKNKKWCCSAWPSSCEGLKKKNRDALLKLYEDGDHSGNGYEFLSTEIKNKMSHKGQVFMTQEEVFIDGKEWGSELLRKYIHHYKIFEYKCSVEDCGITEQQGRDLTLELDHINGVRNNNTIENLRWLCPNCHSLTDTFRGYNKKLNGRVKVTDTELLTALRECSNIRQALQKVGLAAKGGNYERATKLRNNSLVAKQEQLYNYFTVTNYAPMVKFGDTQRA